MEFNFKRVFNKIWIDRWTWTHKKGGRKEWTNKAARYVYRQNGEYVSVLKDDKKLFINNDKINYVEESKFKNNE